MSVFASPKEQRVKIRFIFFAAAFYEVRNGLRIDFIQVSLQYPIFKERLNNSMKNKSMGTSKQNNKTTFITL